MVENRIENEIKLFNLGGPFAYEGNDPSDRFDSIVSILSSEGFSVQSQSFSVLKDLYFTDTEGRFDTDKILLRYREKGDRATVTMKMPYLKNGLGLSRRELEAERFNDSRFDKWKVVQDFVREVYGPVELKNNPVLQDEITRCSARITSKVRSYSFTFDKVVYIDPESGVRSMPCYELEIECLDQAIEEDRCIVSLIRTLTDTYGFEEERISKYARGMAFVRSLKRHR